MKYGNNVMRNFGKIISAIIVIGLFIITFGFESYAQLSGRPDRGYQPGNSYAISDIENINMTGGNVMMNIPLASLPKGRGTSPGFSISLTYDSKIWDTEQQWMHNGRDNDGGPNNLEYTKNLLKVSEDGGWKLRYNYQLRVVNRIEDGHREECNQANAENYSKNSYKFKVEILTPGNGTISFRPVGYHDHHKDGFFEIHPGGRIREARYTQSQGTPICSNDELPTVTTGVHYYSTNGSGIRMYVPYDSTFNNFEQFRHWIMYYPNGTIIENSPPDNTAIQQRITDINGNRVIIKSGVYNNINGIKIEDDLGRFIFVEGLQAVYQIGYNGEELKTTISWKNNRVHRKYDTIGILPPNMQIPGNDSNATAYFNFHQSVDEITLPAQVGSLKYKFTYSGEDTTQPPPLDSTGWGELVSVKTPSDAVAEYKYNYPENVMLGGYLGVITNSIIRKELTYDETYDNQTTEKKDIWLYQAADIYTQITSPGGSISKEESYYKSPYMTQASPDWKSGLVYKVINPDGTTVSRTWQQQGDWSLATYQAINTYISSEITTIPDANGQPALATKKDYKYDQNMNLLEVKEYDWAAAGSTTFQLKRKTVNTYYNQANEMGSLPLSANHYSNPGSPALLNLVKSTEVQDAGGNPASRTEFYYDNATLLTASPTKGNLTLTKTWDSQKGGYSNPLGSNSVSGTVTYDQYGNVLTTTDAKNVTNTITYGAVGGYTGLYPTQTEAASNYASLKRTSTANYDFSTGLVTSATDVDNNLTSATEYDALGRPIKVKAAVNTPSEIWTQTEYDDVNRRVIVRSDLEVKGDGKKIGIQHYDQLGRVRLTRSIENVLTENPYNEADGIKVQTRYQTGNPYSYQLSSNPYRAATAAQAVNEPSMGWTRSKSVNTGRHSEAETFAGAGLPAPWGSNASSTGIVQTDIDADRTLVTDQAGKRRMSKINSLGQLTDVWEIKAAEAGQTEAITFGALSLNGYKTSYQYDTLNNLTKVIQGTQPNRNFTYSSLSRLLSASNPESGTIGYVYDDGGNLTNKTDARGVQTTYGYDALNRVISRSYNDNLTPTVAYTYDNLPNAKGKLTKVSSSVSTTEYQVFDILGRVTQSQQTTDGTTYGVPMTYTYNLSGALIEQKYPSGRVVKNTLDANGMLQQVQSKKANDTFRNYANSFNYTAAGAVSSVRLGNGKWENTTFNSRLQPVQIGLGASATDQSSLKLNFDYGGTSNNGNVLSQTITTPTTGTTAGFTAIQTYTYDELNRLKSAKENIDGNVADAWKQTFEYDRYGNRRFNELNTTTITKNCTSGSNAVVCAADVPAVNPTINQTNNRLDGYTFDTAGNTKIDALGRSFIYDAENKQTEVRDSQNNPIGKYYYDGDGKRVKKVAGNETTIFIYDAAGKLVAEYSNQTSATPQISYLTTDHLGSPRINTDAGGQVTARHDYQPFGEEIQRANYGADTVKQKFTSYERDGEIDLDFFGARNYSYMVGRFVQVDPILTSGETTMPQSWNRYSYTMNNPLNRIDVLGFYTWGDGATDEYKKKFRSWLEDLKKARDGFKEKSKKWNKLNDVIKTIGDEGADTVEIRFSDVYATKDKNGKEEKMGEDEVSVAEGVVTRDGDTAKVKSFITFNTNNIDDADYGVLAHEGQHTKDRKDWVDSLKFVKGKWTYNGALNLNANQRENKAYQITQYAAQGLGKDYSVDGLDLYKAAWGKADSAAVESKLNTARANYMKEVGVPTKGKTYSQYPDNLPK